MGNCAIVGINWGDEGKGRMVDLIAQDYDIVVRYQGGNNAGHTVINEYGKFALHLLPSGIFQKGTVNLLGNGVVVDIERLWEEMEDVRGKGVHIGPDNLLISDRAPIVVPVPPGSGRAGGGAAQGRQVWLHQAGDCAGLRRQVFKKDHHDGRPVLPGISAGAALRRAGMEKPDPRARLRCHALCPRRAARMGADLWRKAQALHLRHRQISPAGAAGGKNVLFEAQLGVLRDIDFGIFPYTSSSSRSRRMRRSARAPRARSSTG